MESNPWYSSSPKLVCRTLVEEDMSTLMEDQEEDGHVLPYPMEVKTSPGKAERTVQGKEVSHGGELENEEHFTWGHASPVCK
jgi:hypothetical protein